MSKRKKIGWTVVAVLVAIQFFQPARNQSKEMLPADFSHMYPVTQKVQALLTNSCYDCHSNQTRYPWYAHIQPLGWWLDHHIKEGKRELNFSEFGTYSHRRQISKLKTIQGSIQDGSMPLGSYTLIHHGARLTKDDQQLMIDWLQKVRDSLSNNSSVHG